MDNALSLSPQTLNADKQLKSLQAYKANLAPKEAMPLKTDYIRTAPKLDTSKISDEQMRKIKNASQDFESVFISQMLGHMFAGVETNEMFGGGYSEEVYRDLMVDEYGKLMSKAGGIGIADHVQREMIQMQQGQQKPKSATSLNAYRPLN